jgi:formylglycine-generating enzyme required for sulfatase activity
MIGKFNSWARPVLLLLSLGCFTLSAPAADDLSGCGQAPPSEDMVCIARGSALIGSNSNTPAERPAHRVEISAFFIDRYEVNNADYAECEKAGRCSKRETPPFYESYLTDDLPVIPASWEM